MRKCQFILNSLKHKPFFTKLINSFTTMAKNFYKSDLAFIEVKNKSDPLSLFKEWMEDYILNSPSKLTVFNLATADSNGRNISNRNLVLRELREEGFAFSTSEISHKIQQIKENPHVAACFLWSFIKDVKKISRQVRVEGVAEELSRDVANKYFEQEPLYCKIRSHICNQGQEVDWDDLKRKHDDLLRKVEEDNKELELPDYQVAYVIKPLKMDFYYAYDNCIADRICFTKSEEKWSFIRISA